MPVRTLEELFDDPHLKATGFFTEREHPTEGPITTFASPLDFEKTKVEFRHHAPRIGGDGGANPGAGGTGAARAGELKAGKTAVVSPSSTAAAAPPPGFAATGPARRTTFWWG